jgi:hypothetical protein
MEEILHQLIGGKHPINSRVLKCLNHPKSLWWRKISQPPTVSLHSDPNCSAIISVMVSLWKAPSRCPIPGSWVWFQCCTCYKNDCIGSTITLYIKNICKFKTLLYIPIIFPSLVRPTCQCSLFVLMVLGKLLEMSNA